MMGNENSQLPGLEINNKLIEVTDSWSLHSATISSGNNPSISIFIGTILNGEETILPLENAAKNLMLHRHPRILKYVSSWKKNGKFHLATEEVVPLSTILTKLTPLQISIGLHSILKALIFLHEKAVSAHNNICCAAIYVTPDGTWKLGGLEYLCQLTKVTHQYLERTKSRRYEKAIPPEVDAGKPDPASIDTFGFGVLAEELLRGRVDETVPALAEFREMCRTRLQNHDIKLRPPLSEVVAHPFLTHDFITLHSFLLELPLKTEPEKTVFFRSLTEKLSRFPEQLVASQLGGLLLSRLVLLDQTAQECLLPSVVTPKKDETSLGLFSVETYREHLVPRLLQMMSVRDAQIRLILLTHFTVIAQAFSADQLRSTVLPELLVGIKDTNDHIVSVTLHVLADLVPMLGAATVIGGNRGKLFTDGRPKSHGVSVRKSPLRAVKSQVPTTAASDPIITPTFHDNLPERPSPDGGEDHSPSSDEETEAWSDWDAPDIHANLVSSITVSDIGDGEVEKISAVNEISIESEKCEDVSSKATVSAVLPDISTLDIKHFASSSRHKDEIDFFEDMVPVISKIHFTQVEENESNVNKGKFDVKIEDDVEGWGEDLDDWGDVSEPEAVVT